MNRRDFTRTIGLGVSAQACAPRLLCAQENVRPPNIVFIIADDLGWADVGYHRTTNQSTNASAIDTPHIDRLAAGGVRFQRHYVMPTCTPTRVGFLTGRYPSRYGVLSPAYGEIFEKDTQTVASLLRANGYTTGIAGKWHMGSPPNCMPLKYGFTTSYGYIHGQIDPYTHNYKTGLRSWHRNDELLTEEGHATDLITDEAIRFVETAREKPFFLYVAYSVPHYPLKEPEKWTAPYKDRIENVSRRWYAASVTHMDHGIGRIVEALDRTGKRRQTVVIFVSDNGGQERWHSTTQYKGRYADKPHDRLGDNRPLRGWKGQVYEGGIRVPGCANWPGVLEPGKAPAPFHIVDWLPTLCRVAGAPLSKGLELDGRDIWPLITRVGTADPSRTFYWKTPGASAVRRGDWKLIVGRRDKRLELYNLADDPTEKKNRATGEPQQVAALQAVLAAYNAGDRERKKE